MIREKKGSCAVTAAASSSEHCLALGAVTVPRWWQEWGHTPKERTRRAPALAWLCKQCGRDKLWKGGCSSLILPACLECTILPEAQWQLRTKPTKENSMLIFEILNLNLFLSNAPQIPFCKNGHCDTHFTGVPEDQIKWYSQSSGDPRANATTEKKKVIILSCLAWGEDYPSILPDLFIVLFSPSLSFITFLIHSI